MWQTHKKKRLLGISLLQDQFQAAVIEDGNVQRHWQCSEPVSSAADIAAALTEAVQQTGFRGHYVSFVVEIKQAAHVHLKTPPMRPRDLALFVARRAQREKTFAAPAAWSYHRTHAPSGEGVLLHFLPQPLLDSVFADCADLGLTPWQWYPLTEVLCCCLSRLPLLDDETTLLVVALNGRTKLVFGHKDGSLVFARDLDHPRQHDQNHNEEKEIPWLAQEINRSLLYVKQQFGLGIKRGWLIGAPPSLSDQIGAMINIELSPSPYQPHTFSWIQDAVSLNPRNDSNLVPAERRRERSRRLYTRISALLIVILVLGSIATTVFIESLIGQQEQLAQSMLSEYPALTKKKQHWADRYAELDHYRDVSADLRENWVPPLPAWYTAYLGGIMPPGIALRSVTVTHQQQHWKVRLTGMVTGGTALRWADDLQELEQRLVSAPYHLRITRSWRRDWLSTLRSGDSRKESSSMTFSIEGILQ